MIKSLVTIISILALAACHGVETQIFTLPDGTQHVDVTVYNKDLIGPNTQVSTTYVCAPGCRPIGNEQAGGTGLLDFVPAVAISGALDVVAASKLRPDTSNVSSAAGTSRERTARAWPDVIRNTPLASWPCRAMTCPGGKT